jgi:hypothetical protein
MNYRLRHDYMTMNDARLGVFGLHVKTSMTGNPRFSDAGPLLDDAGRLLEEFRNGVSAASGRDKNAIALRNTKRDAFRIALDALASHAIIAAKNDLETLISSGFTVVKGRTKKPADNLTVVVGEAIGQASSIMKSVPGARVYLHQYTIDPLSETSQWTQVMSSKPKYVHTGLTNGLKYWFRVIAVGIDGKETYSDPIARIVLFQ